MNRSANTRHEALLCVALWRHGFRYRKNVGKLKGKPDIVFQRERVVIFCDGDFLYGRNWAQSRRKLMLVHNADYWVSRIAANRERDRKTAESLESAGWLVIRVWEGDIRKNVNSVALAIERILLQKRSALSACAS